MCMLWIKYWWLQTLGWLVLQSLPLLGGPGGYPRAKNMRFTLPRPLLHLKKCRAGNSRHKSSCICVCADPVEQCVSWALWYRHLRESSDLLSRVPPFLPQTKSELQSPSLLLASARGLALGRALSHPFAWAGAVPV